MSLNVKVNQSLTPRIHIFAILTNVLTNVLWSSLFVNQLKQPIHSSKGLLHCSTINVIIFRPN